MVRIHRCPRRFPQLDGLLENINRRPANHCREPPVHAQRRGKRSQRPWQHPSDHQGAPRRQQAHAGTGAAYSHQLVGPVDLCHRPADRYPGCTFWHAHLPNRVRRDFVCLCAGLYATNRRNDRQFSIVICIAALRAASMSASGRAIFQDETRADDPLLWLKSWQGAGDSLRGLGRASLTLVLLLCGVVMQAISDRWDAFGGVGQNALTGSTSDALLASTP